MINRKSYYESFKCKLLEPCGVHKKGTPAMAMLLPGNRGDCWYINISGNIINTKAIENVDFIIIPKKEEVEEK